MKGLSSLTGMTPLLRRGEKADRGEHATTQDSVTVATAIAAPRSVRKMKGCRCFEVMVARYVKTIAVPYTGKATVIVRPS